MFISSQNRIKANNSNLNRTNNLDELKDLNAKKVGGKVKPNVKENKAVKNISISSLFYLSQNNKARNKSNCKKSNASTEANNNTTIPKEVNAKQVIDYIKSPDSFKDTVEVEYNKSL